jgi:hypothetical protein
MRTILIAVLLITFTLDGCISRLCGCSPPPTNREIIIGSWISYDVSFNEQDVASDWQNFKLVFNFENYTTEFTDNTAVWPPSGNYTFSDGSLDNIERSDSIIMHIDFLNETELQLSFTEPSSTGSWKFNFNKDQ